MPHSQPRHPIVYRLEHALLARGALDAARRLELIQALLQSMNEQALAALATRYCREYGLDHHWVLYGAHNGNKTPSQPEWAPVFAMDSINPRNGQWRLEEIERIALAPEILTPSRFVTRQESPALEPAIRRGAYVVVDTEQDQVPRQPQDPIPFAVALKDQGLLVRLTRRYEDDRLELTVPDTRVEPVIVPVGTAENRVVGRVVWVAQTL